MFLVFFKRERLWNRTKRKNEFVIEEKGLGREGGSVRIGRKFF